MSSNTKQPVLDKDLLTLNRLSCTTKPSFCCSTHIWYLDKTLHPWYVFFYAGINNLIVFRYDHTTQHKSRRWKCIRVEDVPVGHMQVILWKWAMKTDKLNSDLRRLTTKKEKET